MIDREHELPVAKQAEVLNISRGSVYYLPRPVPERDRVKMINHLEAARLDALGLLLDDLRGAAAVGDDRVLEDAAVDDVEPGRTFEHVALAVAERDAPDRAVIQYQGLTIMDITTATNYTTNLVFNGSSRFLRVFMNPVAVAAGSSWNNSLTVWRSNGVTYAVGDFVTGAIRPPPTASAPSPGTLAAPRGVAMDTNGNIYVADSGNNRVLRFGQAVA